MGWDVMQGKESANSFALAVEHCDGAVTASDALASGFTLEQLRMKTTQEIQQAASVNRTAAGKTVALDDGSKVSYINHQAALEGREGDVARRAALKKSAYGVKAGLTGGTGFYVGTEQVLANVEAFVAKFGAKYHTTMAVRPTRQHDPLGNLVRIDVCVYCRCGTPPEWVHAPVRVYKELQQFVPGFMKSKKARTKRGQL
eukprot:TRINITY_DN11632_c0_g1_i1.p1 TRINITY_DN11632_c0_g1~~TRINITY_DN11632_c0_g1_i1.p1  ORF type:complete len:200 (+),score=47.71 TRINITY_DN11632_c0_g1_i1:331-930(+)